MADSRLALAQSLAQVGHMQFAVLGEREVEEDPKPRLVAEQLEHLSKLADGLLRNLCQGLEVLSISLDKTLRFFSSHDSLSSGSLDDRRSHEYVDRETGPTRPGFARKTPHARKPRIPEPLSEHHEFTKLWNHGDNAQHQGLKVQVTIRPLSHA